MRTKIHILLTMLSVFTLLMVSQIVFADSRLTVMVINSDARIEKYKVTQDEFIKSIPVRVIPVDLGQSDQIGPEVAALYQKNKPDLIYCIGTKAYSSLIKQGYDQNIIFSSILNYTRLPTTQKTYGVSSEVPAQMQFMLYRYIFPSVKKIGLLYSPMYSADWLDTVRSHAEKNDIEILGTKVTRSDNIISALEGMIAQIDALWLMPDPIIMQNQKDLGRLLERCDKHKIPVFSYKSIFIELGACLTVEVDNPTIGRQTADLAMELLSGATPDIKVQFPAGSYIILNLKKVKQYGLPYNEEALGAVNQIVQ